MRHTITTTRRLRLRTWLASDASSYHKHCNTDDVMHFLGGVMTLRQVRDEVRWLQWQQRMFGHTFWLVERKRDSSLLGFCGLIRVTETDSPIRGTLEIGWRIRADMWRNGYAFEAASAVMLWANAQSPVEPVFARIHKHNTASELLARKLLMRRDRKLESKQAQVDASLNVFKKPAVKRLR